jgi:hypothetical protein
MMRTADQMRRASAALPVTRCEGGVAAVAPELDVPEPLVP